MRADSSYQWRRSLITICRTSEWYEALAVRDVCEKSRNSCGIQLSSPTAPYAPPVILQTFSGRIEKPSLGGCIDCQRLDHYTVMTHAKLPFQNLAISSISKGLALICSICLFISGELMTKPFGSIIAILVAKPECH